MIKKCLSILIIFIMITLNTGCDIVKTKSFKPFYEDGMLILLNDTHNEVLKPKGIAEINIDYDIGSDNYLYIDINSEVPLKGVLYYKDPDDDSLAFNENFYIEANQTRPFTIIIGQEELENNIFFEKRHLIKIAFTNLVNSIGKIEIKRIGVSKKEIPSNPYIYLSNDKVKMGINLNWGGGICFLTNKQLNIVEVEHNGKQKIGIDYGLLDGAVIKQNSDVNLLNHHDVGRLIQQSYYGSILEPYVGGYYQGRYCPYNPVQGGDQEENESKIIDFNITDEELYIKIQPRDWAPATICNAYMENRYSLWEDVVIVKNRFVDFSEYTPQNREQEMPAVYTVRSLDTWVTYEGSSPFTNDELVRYKTNTLEAEGRVVSSILNENWAALCNEQDFGVGVYVPGLRNGIYTLFHNNNQITNPNDKYYNTRMELLNATSYMTMTAKVAFEIYKPIEYNSFITTGYVNDMRAQFYRLYEKGENNNSFLNYNK